MPQAVRFRACPTAASVVVNGVPPASRAGLHACLRGRDAFNTSFGERDQRLPTPLRWHVNIGADRPDQKK